MAEFLEERLPVDIRMGASYSDGYNVQIVETAGGAEYRKPCMPSRVVAGRSTTPARRPRRARARSLPSRVSDARRVPSL